MKSSVIVANHPLHPMLIPIPLTSFPLALVGDVIYLVIGGPFWYDFARVMLGVGVAGALLAALPGLVDYLRVIPRAPVQARDDATLHLVCNLSLVGVFLVDFVLRMATDASTGPLLALAIALGVVGNGLLIYAGWLGGNLVYRHRIGVEEPAPELLRVTMSPAERAAMRNPGDES
ncbi:MAG: DUF2231 domain-containing protein [Candidatus Sericytochromatia bacterium]|nr:DUF2231 domain-containing protein [Candidatus Tanganyikabacteria bacterium]